MCASRGNPSIAGRSGCPIVIVTEHTVGIMANPASGRDIRRLVAKASVFPTAEKGRT